MKVLLVTGSSREIGAEIRQQGGIAIALQAVRKVEQGLGVAG